MDNHIHYFFHHSPDTLRQMRVGSKENYVTVKDIKTYISNQTLLPFHQLHLYNRGGGEKEKELKDIDYLPRNSVVRVKNLPSSSFAPYPYFSCNIKHHRRAVVL